MDDERYEPIEVRGHMLTDDSPTCSKLKLQLGKTPKGNSTPVSSLCDSFSNAVLTTPVRNFSNANKSTIIGSTSELKKTPVSSCLHLHHKDILSPFGTPLVKKNSDTTPRRNPRRSCSGRYTNFKNVFEDVQDDDVSQKKTRALIDDILQDDSQLGVASIDIKQREESSEEIVLCTKESTFSPARNEQTGAFLPQNDSHSINNFESEILSDRFHKTGNNVNQTPSVIRNTSKCKAISEPRQRSRKSDISVSSVHKLRLSAKRPSFKRKSVIEEYDPDNDIFAHGVMPTHFNIDSLKDQIGQYLNSSDLPIGLKRSKSCGTLNDLTKPVKTSSAQCSSPKKKSNKHISQISSEDTIKRTVSAPNLFERVTEETKLSKEAPKEGAVRAFLRARDIIMNIHKRKSLNNLKSQDAQHSNYISAKPSSSLFHCNDQDKSEQNTSFESNDSISESESSFLDVSLPPTQQFESTILKEVTAYVEVISNNENISAGVRTELIKLGATVVSNFNRNVAVTHVVFNDGLISTYKKAKKRNIPLVSVLWIEECRKAKTKVHESLYPPYQIERYESPSIVKQLQKRRILHFSSDRPRPSPRRKKDIPNVATTAVDLAEKKFPTRKRSSVPKWVNQVAGDNGMMRILVNMTGIGPGEFKDIVKRPPTPDSEVDTNIDSPLAVRLLRKLAKNLDVCSGESSTKELQVNCTNDSSRPETNHNRDIQEKEGDCEPKNVNNSPPKEIFTMDSSENAASGVDSSFLKNVSHRKRCMKRKLLNTIDETVSLSDDNSVCGEVVNPHTFTPKLRSDKNEKKKKLSESSDGCQENVNVKDADNKNMEQLPNSRNDDPVRRSQRISMYFVDDSKKRKSSPVDKKPSIVCTLLHSVDVEIIASIIDKLGTYILEKNVTSHTTHVVTGDAKRTMKVLKGMVRGCWIVSREWVLKSLEAEKWLDEEEYEMTSFSPIVQKYRLEKLSFGATFKPDIFRDCGSIFVSSKSSAPRGDIVELILLCGGRITSRVGKADIVVGKKHPGITCVTPLWVLDSISAYSLKPFEPYLCT